MVQRLVFWMVITLFVAQGAVGKNFHVTVNGKPGGTGTIESPVDLQSIIYNPAKYGVSPGDVIYVHEGVYIGTYESKLVGSADNYITVMPYENGKVILKREGIQDNDYILLIKGSYTIFRDFVVTSDIYNRISQYQLSPRSDVVTEIGVNLNGKNNKLINFFIYNITGNGINAASGAVENEIYGNIIFYQGYNETSNEGTRIFGHGHSMYLSNDVGRKLVKHNVLFKGYGHGIQFYTEGIGTSWLTGSDFIENISFNAGCLNDDGPADYYGIGEYWNRNFMLGGNESTSNLVFSGNYSYMPAGLEDGTGVQIGYNVINEDGIVEDNYVAGGSKVFYIRNYEHIEGSRNTLIGRDGEQISIIEYPDEGGPFQFAWDNNTYYLDNADFHFGVNSFEEWKETHNVDANSKPYALNELQNHVKVFPNQYEAKRAHVVIYNWENKSTVSVNLSSVLENGDKYYVYNVEDLRQPILEGTYSGPLNIPTNQTSLFPLFGTNVITQPKPTPNEFGTFLVIGRPIDIVEGPTPPKPCDVNITNISPDPTDEEVSVSFSATGECGSVNAFLYDPSGNELYSEENVESGFVFNLHEICPACESGSYQIELTSGEEQANQFFTYNVPSCITLTLVSYQETLLESLNAVLCVWDASRVTASVMNEQGVVVHEQSFDVVSGENQLDVDFSSLTVGNYTVVFNDGLNSVECAVTKDAAPRALEILSCSPSVTYDQVNLQFYSPKVQPVNFNIFNSANESVYFEEISALEGENNNITGNLSGYITGEYVLQIEDDNTTDICEVTKEDVPLPLRIISYTPNPTTGIVTITFYSPETKLVDVRVDNNNGDLILEEFFSAIRGEDNKVDIDLTNQPAGLYSITINDGTNAPFCEVTKEDIPDPLAILSYSPNPTTDVVTIGFYSPQSGTISIIVENNQQQVVMETEAIAINGDGNKVDIDLSEMQAGEYTITLDDKVNTASCKVTKEDIDPLVILSYSPNPTTDVVSVVFFSPQAGSITVEVRNKSNQLIIEQTVTALVGADNKVDIDLTQQIAGSYTIFLDDNVSTASCIVMKEDMPEPLSILSYSPNPTNGIVTVQFFAPQTNFVHVTIKNSSNEIASEQNFSAIKGNNNKLDVDLSSEPAGVYTILLNDESTEESCQVTRIDDYQPIQILSYSPNPTKSIVAVGYYSFSNTIVDVTVVNSSGSQILVTSHSAIKGENNQCDLDLSGFAPGQYVITISDKNTSDACTVTKQDDVIVRSLEILNYTKETYDVADIEYYSPNTTKITIEVFNTSGNMVIRRTESASSGNNNLEVDLSSEVPSIYRINLFDGVSSVDCSVTLKEESKPFSIISTKPEITIDLFEIDYYSPSNRPISVKIIDNTGKVVHQEKTIAKIGRNQIILNLSRLSEGKYDVFISNGKNTLKAEVQIQKFLMNKSN